MWKIKKIVRKGDYNYAVVKGHPNTTNNGYVLHHRIVMENHLGRILNSSEVVHHKNGNKLDNQLDNLLLTTNVEHARIHGLERGKTMGDFICPWCNTLFSRQLSNTHLVKGGSYTTCSNVCRGKLSRYIQLHGRTLGVENAISGNIVRSYKQYGHGNPEET